MQTQQTLLQSSFPLPKTQHSPHRREKAQGGDTLRNGLEERLVTGVYKLPYVRLDQLVRYLNFSHNSAMWVQKSLRSLRERKYIDLQKLPTTSLGNQPYLYMPGTKGIQYLREKDLPINYCSPKERLRSPGHLIHAMRISELILTACSLSTYHPAITLTSYHHDRHLKQFPFQVQVDGKTQSLVPDALLDWYLAAPFGKPGADRLSIFVELDDNEEEFIQFAPKIAKYVAFFEKAVHANMFGIDEVHQVAILAAEGGQRRVNQLQTWTEKELKRLNKEAFKPYFRFAYTSFEKTCIFAPALFLAPVWSTLTGLHSALIEQVA